jgi:hypothetical protein
MNNGNSGSNSGNMPPFPSPFFDHLSLGSMTLDFPNRQLSPGMNSARLPFQTIGSTPVSQTQQPQQQQSQEPFDTEKAKKNMLSVTSNLARISQQSKPDPFYNRNNNQQQGSNQQQQTPSMVTPSGTSANGSFFETSPLMSNNMMDFSTRQSPPTTTAFLSSVLGDTPNIEGKSIGQGEAGGSMDSVKNMDQAQLKQSASVVSKLMNAERKSQTHKNKDNSSKEGGGHVPPPPPPTRLFAPLSEQPVSMRPNSSSQPTAGALLGSNLIRPSRLSTNEDGFFDLPFGDFQYTFSPGEMSRSLGTSTIPESPMSSLRMYPYPNSYSSIMAPPPPQQMASTSNWPQQYQQRPTQYAQSSLSLDAARQAKDRKRPSKRDMLDDDDDDDKPKKKSKKAVKQEDPDEPRITSKHRGVCWYKRTKKWVVQTKVNGKRVHVGYFDDEEKAAEAYKNAVQGIQIKKALEAKQKSQQQQQLAAGEGQPLQSALLHQQQMTSM